MGAENTRQEADHAGVFAPARAALVSQGKHAAFAAQGELRAEKNLKTQRSRRTAAEIAERSGSFGCGSGRAKFDSRVRGRSYFTYSHRKSFAPGACGLADPGSPCSGRNFFRDGNPAEENLKTQRTRRTAAEIAERSAPLASLEIGLSIFIEPIRMVVAVRVAMLLPESSILS
jgi:hypothetical protein